MKLARIDPEFEKYCINLRKDIERTLKKMMPKNDIQINNSQIQKIIAKLNKQNNLNIKLKKLGGKRNRYRLIFDDKYF